MVVENLRPGSMDKLGLNYDNMKKINPRIIYATISGFGRLPGFESEYSNRPAFDIVAEAMTGIMDLVGFADKPPTYTLYGMADVHSGLATAYGIMQALFMRERTGLGQMVDSAMVDNMLALNERMVTLYSLTGEEPKRGSLKHVWPRGAFKCKDGYIALNVPDNIIWKRLANTIQRPDLVDDPRSADGVIRGKNAEFLQAIIEDWMADKTRSEAVTALNEAGVPTGPVYSAKDVFDDQHFRRREMLVDIDDPEVGPSSFARTPIHLSAAPRIPTEPAPNLGQHTRPILQELLHYTSDKIDELIAAGVISASK